MARRTPGIAAPLTLAALAACVWLAPALRADEAAPADPLMAADQKIIAEERDHSQVLDNLEYLSDMIGPRLTGSDRLTLASNWTMQKMKEYGLQNVHLEPYTIPRGWVRGTVTAHIVEPNGLPIELAQLAWSPGTRGRVSGPVVPMKVDKEEDLAAYKGKLHGAFIILGKTPDSPEKVGALPLPDQKPETPIPAFNAATAPPTSNAPYSPPSMSDYRKIMALRKKVMDFARAEGASGILMDSNKPYFLLNMTGSWTSNSMLPSFFVAHENLLMMERLLHRNQPVTVEVNSSAHFTHGPLTVYNTVGDIPGSSKADEIVLLGGHLDSWDLGTGSTDNGTGSMAVLEAARAIKATGLTPARTLRFVMFTGEEEGLMGSQAYVEAHKKEMEHYDVVFVHDTGTGRVKGAWLQERAECKPMLAQQFDLLTTLGLVTDTPNLLPGKMNGTDHASFDDAGVPAFAFNQDEANYGLNHHSQADTFDKVRPDDLKQGAAVLAVLGYNAAEMPDRYPRTPAKPQRSEPDFKRCVPFRLMYVFAQGRYAVLPLQRRSVQLKRNAPILEENR